MPHDPIQPVDDAVKLIVTEPALTAVMKPVVDITPATPPALLLQVPPLTLDNAVSVSPTIIIDGELITGVTFTNIDFVLKQPLGIVYVITVLPAVTPVTTVVGPPGIAIPEPPPTVAMELFALSQVPEPVDVNVTDEPSHTLVVPVIAGAAALTATLLMLRQPVPIAYVMFVEPTAAPVTTPVVPPTDAIALLALLHVPPLTLLLNVSVAP